MVSRTQRECLTIPDPVYLSSVTKRVSGPLPFRFSFHDPPHRDPPSTEGVTQERTEEETRTPGDRREESSCGQDDPVPGWVQSSKSESMEILGRGLYEGGPESRSRRVKPLLCEVR